MTLILRVTISHEHGVDLYSTELDMWSLGCTLYGTATGKAKGGIASQGRRNARKKTPTPGRQLGQILGEAGMNLLERLLNPEPQERISAKEPWPVLRKFDIIPVQPATPHGSSPPPTVAGVVARPWAS